MRVLPILLLTIAIGCIEDTLAIKCYNCISEGGMDDPCFVGDTEKIHSIECPTGYTNCVVLRAPVNGVDVVYRTCSRDYACDYVPAGAECTLCDEDNCNSGSVVVSSTPASNN